MKLYKNVDFKKNPYFEELMQTKKVISISIDERIAKESKKILKELGFKFSTYIELVLKSLVDSRTKTAAQVYEELFEGLGQELIKNNENRKKPAPKDKQRQKQ